MGGVLLFLLAMLLVVLGIIRCVVGLVLARGALSSGVIFISEALVFTVFVVLGGSACLTFIESVLFLLLLSHCLWC